MLHNRFVKGRGEVATWRRRIHEGNNVRLLGISLAAQQICKGPGRSGEVATWRRRIHEGNNVRLLGISLAEQQICKGPGRSGDVATSHP